MMILSIQYLSVFHILIYYTSKIVFITFLLQLKNYNFRVIYTELLYKINQ